MTTFNLPDLGEGLREAEIIQWHVGQGDHVVADQPLVSVETEKAVVEIPSPSSARVARICAKVGDRIKVGAPLVEFEEGQRADTGTVVAFTVVHLPVAGRDMPVPFGWARIVLDGADVPVPHVIGGSDLADVAVGRRVEAVWAPPGERPMSWEAIRHFRLVAS